MHQYKVPDIGGYFILIVFSIILFRFARRIYRRYFHPLKQFKGLPEACVSENWLYKTTKDGVAEEIFEDLHKKYSQSNELLLK